MENDDEKISEGFILLARKIAAEDSWVRQLKPQYFKIMVMLLLKARWKAGPYFPPSREQFKVERGQYAAPVRRLAKECGVSYQVMRTGLGLLALRGFLTHKVTQGVTVVTILNYERYQDVENYINAIPNADLTQGQRKLNAQKKQGNKDKKVKKEYTRIFEVWNSHPKIFPKHRRLTGPMKEAIGARLRDFTCEQICQAIKNYGDSSEGFWVKQREVKKIWSLAIFLSRGEGEKVDKFLPGPLTGKARSRTRRQFTGTPEKFIQADEPSPDKAATDFWRTVISNAKGKVPDRDIEVWLRPAIATAITEDILTISVPNKLYSGFIKENFIAKLESIAGRKIKIIDGECKAEDSDGAEV